MSQQTISFIDGLADYPEQLRAQILDEIKTALPAECKWVDSERDADHSDVLSVTLFPAVPADILLMFDLSDRNHFLLRNSEGELVVSKFKAILVPGDWLRDALLADKRLGLAPEQVIAVGSPRIDLLGRLFDEYKAGNPEPNARPNILFAAMPDNWSDQNGVTMCIEEQMEETLEVLHENFDVVSLQDTPNREYKDPTTQELLEADVVITDYASVMYEAWSLGKPVIFPRWLTGDRVLDKAPKSAEAHVYRNRIGHHANNLFELFDLLESYPDLGLGEGVEEFMQSYVTHRGESGAVMAKVLVERSRVFDAAAEFKLSRLERSFLEAMGEKDWKAALSHVSALVELSPQKAKNYERQAGIYNKLDEPALEIASLEASLNYDSANADVLNRLGTARFKLSHNRAAAAAWKKAIEIKPALGTSAMYYKIGFALETRGADGAINMAAAKEAYAIACEKDTKNNAAVYGVGMLHCSAGRWKEAQAPLKAMLEQMPFEAELYYRLGMAHDRCYEWAEAEDCYYRALTFDTTKIAWHYRLGLVRERQGLFDKAAEAYLFAATFSRKHQPTWFYRAGYVLEKAGRIEEACEAYTRVASEEVAQEEPHESYIDGFTQHYPSLLLEMLDHNPSDAALWFECSKKLEEAGDIRGALDAAEKALQRATQPDASYRKWHANLSARLNKGAEHKARLEFDCTNPDEWERYSLVLQEEGDLDAAIDTLRQAILRSNAHQEAWYHRLGVMLVQQGRLEDACEAFRCQHILQRPHGAFEAKFEQNESLRETARYREFHDTLPLMQNAVLYESFSGEGVSDNPLGIFNQVQNDPRFEGWLHIWSIRDSSKIPANLRHRKDVIFVERDSALFQRYLATVPYLISNATFPFYYTRRDGQHYLNTWHGTPLKTLGYDIRATPLQRANTARNLIQASMFISPNQHTENIMLDHYGVRNLFTGTALISGYPRIDMLVNATDETKADIRKQLGLDPSKPVVLFAPTYRGHWATPELEAQSLADSIEKMKSPDYNLVFRGHYFAEKFIDEMDLDVNIAPHAVDTCSLLSIVDVLITDYSSIFYDFLITKRPVIHFVPDWDYYVETRGMYFTQEQLPGLICEDEDSLIETLDRCIADPEAQITPQYLADLERYCNFEDGKAAERVVQALFFDLPSDPVHREHPEGSKHFAFYNGVCDTGAQLRNLRGLTAATKEAGHINTLIVDRYLIINDEERTANTQDLLDRSDVIMRFGRATLSLEESWLDVKLKTAGFKPTQAQLDAFETATRFEVRRIIGRARFDAVIDLNARRPFWTRTLVGFDADKHLAKIGGEFIKERDTLTPEFTKVQSTLGDFDTLLSDTAQISEINKTSLALEGTEFDVLMPFVDLDVPESTQDPEDKERRVVCFTADPLGFLEVEFGKAKSAREQTTLTLFVPPALMSSANEIAATESFYREVTVLPDTQDSLPALQNASLVIFPQGVDAYFAAFTEASTLGHKCIVLGDETRTKGVVTMLEDAEKLREKLGNIPTAPAAIGKPTGAQHNAEALQQFLGVVSDTGAATDKSRSA